MTRLHPAAVAATTPEARRGRSLLERMSLPFPGLMAAAVRVVLALPPSRFRTGLIRYLYTRAYAAYNRRDWELNTALHHPDRYALEWGLPRGHPAGARESYRGVEGYLEFLELWHSSFDQFRFRFEQHLDAGSGALLVLIDQRARGAGSGLDLDAPAASLDRFEDGRLVHQTFFTDRESAFRVTGLTPGDAAK